ncbi:DUF6732 family protein [Maritimibacter sp. DP1N21-5]|uniref:DUF6732 family protein n=1 Tax=Maritimibacter sp. DP1N21-5 TaxID=2836867 RepID=UPI001C4976BE|nr:DUF6732 family protein [Maritimibacter sp. DP1N21-5]MBV7408468.1 hypothetical protein [Maritimibacter sp. DP1N21-5]
MKFTIAALLLLLPGMALAHPGHLADAAGHDHWVAGVAIGVAIGVAVWGALRGRGKKVEDTAADEAETAEPQEA